MTPAPLQVGQAPSELALNSAGFTPLAFANALRIGSSSPVYVAGLLRREPLIAPWSTETTPSRPDTEPWISELLPEPTRQAEISYAVFCLKKKTCVIQKIITFNWLITV